MDAVNSCFFLSGFAALLFQVAWQRMALRLLGSTLPAVSLVLSLFMLGLALGALVASRALPRITRPLLAYGTIECVVAIFGLASLLVFQSGPNSLFVFFMSVVGGVSGQSASGSTHAFDFNFILRACFVGFFLLMPTTLMGATFAFVGKYFESKRLSSEARNPSTVAYLANLSGGALGTICSGFLLMPDFGLCVCVAIASMISLGVAVALFFADRLDNSVDPFKVELAGDGYFVMNSSLLYFIAFAGGAAGLILEVVWSRLFSLLVGSSSYSLAAVVSIYMIGLAAGTAIVARAAVKISNKGMAIGFMCLAMAACLYSDLWIIQSAPWLFAFTHTLFSGMVPFWGYLLERIVLISSVVLPPAVIAGGIFPFLLQAVKVDCNDRERGLAVIYAFSTMGSVAGAFSGGMIFVPYFGQLFTSGMESTICLVIFLEIAVAVVLLSIYGKRVMIALPLVLLVVTMAVRPAWNRSLISSGVPFLSLPPNVVASPGAISKVFSESPTNRLLFYREGLNTTVTVNANEKTNTIYLKNDGKVEAALPIHLNQQAPSSDLSTHQMLGRLPFALHRGPLKNVFVVGFGSGATCGAALVMPELERLTVAEVEPAIYDAQPLFQESNGAPLRKEWLATGRIIPICQDARALLTASAQKYDAIISQPAEPWISGAADLFSIEFWRLCRSRLTEGGIVSQWIQLYAIDPDYLGILGRTFQSVFPYSYAIHHRGAGEMILIGSMEPVATAQLHNLNGELVAMPDSLSAACRQIAETYHDDRINTDDNMAVEYGLPERLYLNGDMIERNLSALTNHLPR